MLFLTAAAGLAVVFATSAVTKWGDAAGTRRSVTALGLPERWALPVALVLPPLEIAVAVSLVVQPQVGGPAALTLLLAFVSVVVRVLVQGRRAECGCFGRLSRAEVSSWTLVRLGLLAVAAALASSGPALAMASPSETAWALATGLGWAVLLLGAERRRSRPVDAAASTSGLTALDGTPSDITTMAASGLPVLVVFLSPDCTSCHELTPALDRWRSAFGHSVQVVAVVLGAADHAALGGSPDGGVLLDPEWRAAKNAGILMTPAALSAPTSRPLAASGWTEPVYGAHEVRATLGLLLSGQDPCSAPEDVDQASVPVQVAHVSALEHRDGLVLHDELLGTSVRLDVRGAEIWRRLDGRISLLALASELANDYAAEMSVVLPDVVDTLRSLAAHGLVAEAVDAPLTRPDPLH